VETASCLFAGFVYDQQPSAGGKQSDQAHIVRQLELPVASSAEIIDGQSVKKTFLRLRRLPGPAPEYIVDEQPAPASAEDERAPMEVLYPVEPPLPSVFPRLKKRLETAAPLWRDTQLRLHPRAYYFDRDRENANDTYCRTSARQIIEAFPWDTGPECLLPDWDAVDGSRLQRPVQSRQIEVLITAQPTARCHRSRMPSEGSTRAERRPASPAASTAAAQVSARAIA